MMRTSHRHHHRRGIVAVLVAVSLVGIVGIAAIVLDGGMLLQERRHAQATADAASLAAAISLYNNFSTDQGLDPSGTAVQSALAVAADNGYNNDGTHSVVTVNIPPKSGLFVGVPGYAEVLVQFNQRRSFSNIFGQGALGVGARAVARGLYGLNDSAILVMDLTIPASIQSKGNGNISVPGGGIIVNSENPGAGSAIGNGTVSGQQVDIFGSSPGYTTTGGGSFQGTVHGINTAIPPTADPFHFSLAAPDPSALPVQTVGTGNPIVLQPGRYIGGISLSGKSTAVMMPGLYYMDGGSFSWTGQSSVTGTGVTIFSNAGFKFAGQGTMSITPPASGPYQGISIFMDRTVGAPIDISGNGNVTLGGTLYAPSSDIRAVGNGNFSVGGDSISLTLNSRGNGNYTVVKPLIPPKGRIIQLVE